MEEKYMSLITDYLDGTLSPEREKEFNGYVQEGHIRMEEVESLAILQGKMIQVEKPEPSEAMRAKFYENLAEAQSNAQKSNSQWFEKLNQFVFGRMYGKLAFGALVLFLGVMVGRNVGNSPYKNEISDLNAQMTEMREMMMMAMLDKESVTDRLKGVQMSSQLSSSNQKVIDALFITLNKDKSTNVRMAALNTLAQYAADPQIREGLVNSISQQQSPLMQVALAELMVELQETKAIDEFKSILDNEFTPDEVKTTLKESIEKII